MEMFCKVLERVDKEEFSSFFSTHSLEETCKNFSLNKKQYLRLKKLWSLKHSKEVTNILREQSCLKKYGVRYVSQDEEKKRRSRITNLSRYGVENPFASKEVQKKIVSKHLQDYGSLSKFESEKKKKRAVTNLKKYGFASPAKNAVVKQKAIKTNLIKYLNEWAEKSKTSKFYETAIEVWTTRDVLKYETAKMNHLNYLSIYTNDLKVALKEIDSAMEERIK